MARDMGPALGRNGTSPGTGGVRSVLGGLWAEKMKLKTSLNRQRGQGKGDRLPLSLRICWGLQRRTLLNLMGHTLSQSDSHPGMGREQRWSVSPWWGVRGDRLDQAGQKMNKKATEIEGTSLVRNL